MPGIPNLSRVKTPTPGASAPSSVRASVFIPGLPSGPPSPGGGSWLSKKENEKLPIGLPGGTPGGKGNVAADPTIPVGKGSGGGHGSGPARPAHGPVAISGPKVGYPSLAEKEGNSGVVKVACMVGPDGTVTGAKIVQRSEADALDNAALTAAKKWTFRPAEDSKGRQVSSTAKLEFRFVLGKEPEVKQL